MTAPRAVPYRSALGRKAPGSTPPSLPVVGTSKRVWPRVLPHAGHRQSVMWASTRSHDLGDAEVGEDPHGGRPTRPHTLAHPPVLRIDLGRRAHVEARHVRPHGWNAVEISGRD